MSKKPGGGACLVEIIQGPVQYYNCVFFLASVYLDFFVSFKTGFISAKA